MLKMGLNGWVRSVEVNGKVHKVKRMPVTTHSGAWYRPIRGIVHHATAGCGDLAGLRSVLQSRKVSAHFGIDRNGNIAQFVSLNNQAWHACDANDEWIGVEHIAYSSCKHTDKQLEASAALFAGIIQWVGHHKKGHIPVEHQGGTPPAAGIADHVDGGASWGNHGDGLRYAPAPTWDYKKYLATIKHNLGTGPAKHTHGDTSTKPKK